MSTLIDSQLHETMRIVSGPIRPTPLQWLPILSHIAPPNIRRTDVTAKFIRGIQAKSYSTLLYIQASVSRLQSRGPIWFYGLQRVSSVESLS